MHSPLNSFGYWTLNKYYYYYYYSYDYNEVLSMIFLCCIYNQVKHHIIEGNPNTDLSRFRLNKTITLKLYNMEDEDMTRVLDLLANYEYKTNLSTIIYYI